MVPAKKTREGRLAAVALCCIGLAGIVSAGCASVHQLYAGPKRPTEEIALVKVKRFALARVCQSPSREDKPPEFIAVKDRAGRLDVLKADADCYGLVRAVDGKTVASHNESTPRPRLPAVGGLLGGLIYKDNEQYALLPGSHTITVQIYMHSVISSGGGTVRVTECWAEPIAVQFDAEPGRSYVLTPKGSRLDGWLAGWSVDIVQEGRAEGKPEVRPGNVPGKPLAGRIYAMAFVVAAMVRTEAMSSAAGAGTDGHEVSECRSRLVDLVASAIRSAPGLPEAGRIGNEIAEILNLVGQAIDQPPQSLNIGEGPDLYPLMTTQAILDCIVQAMDRAGAGGAGKGSQMAAPLLKPFSKRLASFAAKAKNGLSKDETVVFQRLRQDWHRLESRALKRRQFSAHRQQIDDITRTLDEIGSTRR